VRLGGVLAALLLLATPVQACRVALDAGHDDTQPGATSARGVSEVVYNRQLAALTLAALHRAGFADAFIVGQGEPRLPLLRRTELARAGGATLFLSLHHDSVQPHYLQDWVHEGRPRRHSDHAQGYALLVATGLPDSPRSLAFAAALGRALRAQGLTPSTHHGEPIPGEGYQALDAALGIWRFDRLAVLRSARMPAVLLEAGVILHREEEARIRAGQLHPRVVAAIVQGVRAFCPPSAGAPAPSYPRPTTREPTP
jgi:N-acetylmuramoyl-L-alanine amidase